MGDESIIIERIANLENAGDRSISYVDSDKHFDTAAASGAACLIVPSANNRPQFKSRALIEVANPKLAFSQIAAILHPPIRREAAIDPTAVLAKTADVALTAFIGPNAVVGEYARIGSDTRVEAGAVVGASVTIGSQCVIHPNVVLYDGVSIGDRVILHVVNRFNGLSAYLVSGNR